jgi:hypothetical protein
MAKQRDFKKETSIIQVEKIAMSKNNLWLKVFISQKNVILLHRNYLNEILKKKSSK